MNRGGVAGSQRFAFMAGLPRSGSTLIANLLNQRQDTHATRLTDTAEVFRTILMDMRRTEQYRSGARYVDTLLSGILPALYREDSATLIVDKCRLWGTPYYRRALAEALDYPPRILAPVRPLTEIVASFVRLCRAAPDNYIDRAMVAEDFHSYWRKPIDDARVDWLLLPNGHLGSAMLGLHGAYQDDSADLFHVIEYGTLTTDPLPVMRGIEAFLDLEPFDYSFTQIAGQPHNDAEVYGIPNMHHVRERIERIDPAPETILSPYAMARCELEDFWS